MMSQPVPVQKDVTINSPGAQPNKIPPSAGDLAQKSMSTTAPEATSSDTSQQTLDYLPIDHIQPNENQPRQRFNESSLKTLADSIAREGLMQPIVVRPSGGIRDDSDGTTTYEIVAGERRWRAAAIAGLQTIPAIVQLLDDQQTAEWALIENLQREDLNPIERALAFERLQKIFELSHEQVAQRVGLERSSVTNLLRLLSLSDQCRRLVEDGLLGMGQARAIAGLSDHDSQDALAGQTLKEGLSVRKVERLARQFVADKASKARKDDASSSPAAAANKAVRSAYFNDLEQQLSDQLATPVRIRPGRKKGSGTLQLEFFSLEQFDDLINRLGAKLD